MSLRSRLFKGDPVFEKCLVLDSGHITPGSKGFHVAKIHDVLMKVDKFFPAKAELADAAYGPTTAAGVLAYKKNRRIINTSYQKTADNIVGKMTIQSMDDEMLVYDARRRARFGNEPLV